MLGLAIITQRIGCAEIGRAKMRLIDADALKAYIEDYACRPCKEYYLDRDGVRCNFCSFQFCLDGIDRYSVQRTGKIDGEGKDDAEA